MPRERATALQLDHRRRPARVLSRRRCPDGSAVCSKTLARSLIQENVPSTGLETALIQTDFGKSVHKWFKHLNDPIDSRFLLKRLDQVLHSFYPNMGSLIPRRSQLLQFGEDGQR